MHPMAAGVLPTTRQARAMVDEFKPYRLCRYRFNTFATTTAIHMTVNAVWRNGAHAECSCSVGGVACLVLAFILWLSMSASARAATLCRGDRRSMPRGQTLI